MTPPRVPTLVLLGFLGSGTLTALVGALPAGSPVGPGKVEESSVRCVNLPPAPNVVSRNLWMAKTKAKLPSAVLVLFPNKEQDVKALLTSPVWQNFAEDHHLGLAALTVAGIPLVHNMVPSSVPASNPALGVLRAIDGEFGGDLPLAIYAWPQQADLASDIVAASPKRVLGWCLRAPGHLPALSGTTPPGIVVCPKENKALYDVLLSDFAAGRKKGALLTWVAVAGDSANNLPSLDSFVRDYFPAASVYKSGLVQWTNIDSGKPMGNIDADAKPAVASFLPHPALYTAWTGLHSPGGPAIAQQQIFRHEEDTRNPKQPKLSFSLRLPVGGTGEIRGVIAYCTWEHDDKAIAARLQNKDWFLIRYADAHHLALLTWSTANAFANAKSADERSPQENFKDDLGFDKLADAWERGTHALCYRAGLPENNFLLYGLSRGAQWAHRLALRKPEHFLAVSIHVNSSYDWPTPAARNILWLQTTGEREYGYPAALRFYARCREMDYPIMFKAGENLGHANSPQIEKICQLFFDYAMEVKAKRDEWIAHADHAPGHKVVLPTMYSLSGLGDAPYCADLINQEVYGAEERDLVPVSQRVFLPNKALAEAWGEMADVGTLSLVSNPQGKTPEVNAVPPASTGKPRLAEQASSMDQQQSPMHVDGPTTAVPATTSAVSGRPPESGTATTSAAAPIGDDQEEFAAKYRLSVRRAISQSPDLAQSQSALNSAFVVAYHRLQASSDPLLKEPSWPEQLLQVVRTQSVAIATASPDFQREFRASVQRTLLLYPTVAEADSAMNSAFLAEYHRLKKTGSDLLNNPGWPEQVAHAVEEKASKP